MYVYYYISLVYHVFYQFADIYCNFYTSYFFHLSSPLHKRYGPLKNMQLLVLPHTFIRMKLLVLVTEKMYSWDYFQFSIFFSKSHNSLILSVVSQQPSVWSPYNNSTMRMWFHSLSRGVCLFSTRDVVSVSNFQMIPFLFYPLKNILISLFFLFLSSVISPVENGASFAQFPRIGTNI